MKSIFTRNDLFKTFLEKMVIMEIGVFKGDFSKFILTSLNPKELHLVDPFEGLMMSGDKDGENIIYTDLSIEYQNLKNFFHNDNRVIIHKGYSKTILNQFPDNYFDLIYIDGNHSYAGVSIDLELGYQKIKNGGLLSGHDYTIKFPGCVRAVNDFCLKFNQKIKLLTEDGCPTFLIIADKK